MATTPEPGNSSPSALTARAPALTARAVESAKPKAGPYELRDGAVTGLLLRVQPSGIKTWYVTYARGKRWRIGRAPAITLQRARTVAKQVQAEYERTGDDPVQAKRQRKQAEAKAKASTLGAFITETWAPVRRAEHKSGEAEVGQITRNFSPWFERPMESITPWLVQGWRKQRLEAGVGAKTINRAVGALRSALQQAVRAGLLEANPLAELKPLKVDNRSRVRFLTPDEEARLRDSLRRRDDELRAGRDRANAWRAARGYATKPPLGVYPDHVTPIVLLLMNTGCRPGELFSLEWEQVDIRNRTLTVLGMYSKTGKGRHIPLSREAVEVLTEWKRQTGGEGLVFPGDGGEPMERPPRAITRVIRAAGIERFRPYDLRHSFASRMVMNGIDLFTVGALLGHSKAETTQIYAHLSDDHLREAVTRVFDQ